MIRTANIPPKPRAEHAPPASVLEPHLQQAKPVAGAVPSLDTEEERNRLPWIVGILAVIVAALVVFSLYRNHYIHPSLHQLQAPTQQRQQSTAPSTDSSAVTPATTPAVAPVVPSTPTPDQTATSTPPPDATPEAKAVPNRVLNAREGLQPRVDEQVLSAPTWVPEQTMRSRLTFAPPPLYPKLVGSVPPRGDVVFMTIINKDGSVQGLTPLAGDRQLRDAAANAVREWRFTPVTVHNQPVAVRTVLHIHITPGNNTSPNR